MLWFAVFTFRYRLYNFPSQQLLDRRIEDANVLADLGWLEFGKDLYLFLLSNFDFKI